MKYTNKLIKGRHLRTEIFEPKNEPLSVVYKSYVLLLSISMFGFCCLLLTATVPTDLFHRFQVRVKYLQKTHVLPNLEF